MATWNIRLELIGGISNGELGISSAIAHSANRAAKMLISIWLISFHWFKAKCDISQDPILIRSKDLYNSSTEISYFDNDACFIGQGVEMGILACFGFPEGLSLRFLLFHIIINKSNQLAKRRRALINTSHERVRAVPLSWVLETVHTVVSSLTAVSAVGQLGSTVWRQSLTSQFWSNACRLCS